MYSIPNLAAFLILILIININGSTASSIILNSRKLATIPISMIAQAPGPTGSNIVNSKSTPAPEPTGGLDVDDKSKCLSPSKACRDRLNLTACVLVSTTAPKEVFLLVKNDGESPVEVNVNISYTKITFLPIHIRKQEAQKINISTNVAGNPSIVLSTGNKDYCTIQTRPWVSYSKLFGLSFYLTHGTRVYGSYILILTVLIAGMTWACYKSRKNRREGSGVSYQQLEMGKQDSLAAADHNVETAEGWDEGWDDDWDESKALKSPRASENVSENGLSSGLRI